MGQPIPASQFSHLAGYFPCTHAVGVSGGYLDASPSSVPCVTGFPSQNAEASGCVFVSVPLGGETFSLHLLQSLQLSWWTYNLCKLGPGTALSCLNTKHLSCLNSRHLSCLSNRHLSCRSSRHPSCFNRRHLSCLNRGRDSCRPPASCCYVFW